MTTDAWFEPTDSNVDKKPQYPYNNVRGFESGHYEEYDNTPGNERIRVQHRSGSFNEYQATGNVVHKIVGNGYHITIKDQNVKIEGACKIEIMKDAEIHVGGNMHMIVDGDMNQVVKGNYNLTVQGDQNVSVEGQHQILASDLNHQSSGDTTLSGNLNVRGDIICQQTVSALGNLTAGGHLSIQGSIMAQGMIPATGGEPLPHMITGIFPGLGMMVNTIGAIEIGSTMPIIIESAKNTLITAPTNIINGITAINGATTITGATAIKGAFSATGMSTLTGGANIGGSLYSTHTHSNGNMGSPTGPPIA